jgi:hypothetical protein
MTHDDLTKIAADSLAELMDDGSDEAPLWRPDELGFILQHQLATEIHYDLGRFDQVQARDVASLIGLAGPPAICTFGDLFQHPNPPVALLDLTRQFAKACRTRGDGPMPAEIATVVYLASIAAALVRRQQRITLLDDDALEHALRWSLDQQWLDPATRGLLRQAQQSLNSEIP